MTYGCGAPALRVARAGSLVFDPSKHSVIRDQHVGAGLLDDVGKAAR